MRFNSHNSKRQNFAKASRYNRRKLPELAFSSIEALENRLLMSTNSWKAAVSGNWEDGSKWSLGHAPTASEDVLITAAGTYTISVHGSTDVASTVVLGSATAHPTLNLTSDDTNGYAFLTVGKGFTNNSIIALGDNSANGYVSNLTVSAGTLTNTATGTITAAGAANASVQPDTITANLLNQGGTLRLPVRG